MSLLAYILACSLLKEKIKNSQGEDCRVYKTTNKAREEKVAGFLVDSKGLLWFEGH